MITYNSYEQLIDLISGKGCAVLGLGVSNLPLTRLLLALGVAKSVTVYDKKGIDELGEDARALADAGVRFVKGFDNIDADVIFRSPGIRPDIDGIRDAVERGAILTSEIEMLLKMTPARTFSLTGSDGKTTSTTLTGKFLEKKYTTFVGGNIGTPLLDVCDKMTKDDCVVLELSSFQLMTLADAPECAAITNLSPNHLDWHTDLGEYARAKRNIVGERTKRVVLNADCDYTLDFGKELLALGGREVIFFSSKAGGYGEISGIDGAKLLYLNGGKITVSDGESECELLDTALIRIPGKHNIENYMTAIGMTYGFVDVDVYSAVASEFCGVEHRLELVRTIDGVDFYNSSIDSSPTRTSAALSALGGRDAVVICGGYDKNLDYTPLAESIARSTVSTVVLTGATAGKIHAALLSCEGTAHGQINIIRASDFENALVLARESARRGGCVLLSPASASFDRFKNFAERGRYFKKLVCELD